MLRDQPLVDGEVYHIFNRGAHKQEIFIDPVDYERFLLLAYLANSVTPVNVRNTLAKYKGSTFAEIFDAHVIEESLVDILAYALMPNHYHLVLRQKCDGGITTFMRKLGTGYTMSYNKKHEHSGVIFQGRFKSRHVGSEPYFRYIFTYVHLNSVALVEPEWEERGIKNPSTVRKFLNEYPYSSFYDYAVQQRPQTKLLAVDQAPDFLKTQNDLEEMLNTYTGFTKVEPL